MAPLLDSYRPAGNRYPSPKAAKMRQRRAERFESTRSYRPAGNRYPSQNAARMRQRRADRSDTLRPLVAAVHREVQPSVAGHIYLGEDF